MPKVCKIMAFMAILRGFRAISLYTFGDQGLLGSRDKYCSVRFRV